MYIFTFWISLSLRYFWNLRIYENQKWLYELNHTAITNLNSG